MLGSYADPRGRRREVIARAGAAGSVLVLDRDAATRGDVRLVAHLAADEPSENATLVCRRYLEDGSGHRYRCPRLTRSDLLVEPFRDDSSAGALDAAARPWRTPRPGRPRLRARAAQGRDVDTRAALAAP